MQLHSLNICTEKTSKILTEGELYEVLTNRSLKVAMGKKYANASLQLKLLIFFYYFFSVCIQPVKYNS